MNSAMFTLAAKIKSWGQELGFQQIGITDTDLTQAENFYLEWVQNGMHGELDYMTRHGTKRTRPGELIPDTVRIISARIDYFPPHSAPILEVLDNPELAFISRYAVGRDYHKLIRKRLEQLARRIQNEVGPFGYRAFADSAPVLEKPIAQKAGLGWIGKHSNLLNRRAGSWFFLGELYTDLPLPVDSPESEHCGQCEACISACPTKAIVAPYVVDARRCISYLTIELKGPIPEEFRSMIGNRIFGCDDCQLVCPWNRFASETEEEDFTARHGLDSSRLVALFNWDREQFYRFTEGSAIRRLGYEHWLRNIAVALGNAPTNASILHALRNRKNDPSALVREHTNWALKQHGEV